jgi:monoamine oxidase
MEYDVVITGAGAAGLIAARELARAGRSVLLLEARGRAGGRLHNVVDPRALGPIELGAEFVHGRPEVTYSLLREFGSTVIDDAESSFVFRNGALSAERPDPFPAVRELLASALERDEDESVDALIARKADVIPSETAQWVRRLVGGFDAADTARASARAIAQEWSGSASAEGPQSRPLGGYAPLVAHLARSLDPRRVDVRFGAVATRVALEERGVRVEVRERGREHAFRARVALVTVSHGVLRAAPGAEGSIAFDPPLPSATADAIERIAMGPVVKIVLCFRTAFWEKLNGGAWRDGAFFNGEGAFPTFWTQLPLRANTLVAWAGGPAAERLARTSGRISRSKAPAGISETHARPKMRSSVRTCTIGSAILLHAELTVTPSSAASTRAKRWRPPSPADCGLRAKRGRAWNGRGCFRERAARRSRDSRVNTRLPGVKIKNKR